MTSHDTFQIEQVLINLFTETHLSPPLASTWRQWREKTDFETGGNLEAELDSMVGGHLLRPAELGLNQFVNVISVPQLVNNFMNWNTLWTAACFPKELLTITPLCS